MDVLLYGATGYSGRLIAARAQARWADGRRGRRLIVAGRDGAALQRLAQDLGVEFRVFDLSDPRLIDAGLQDVSVVVNAAGPFAMTAERIAKATLRVGCHYVDINGEVDVYKCLDDLGYLAKQRGVTMVCGAGHSASASDLLLEGALNTLATQWTDGKPRELGAIRIGLSQVNQPSRGSVQTALRAVREQVLVVRDRGQQASSAAAAPAAADARMVLTYVPFGQLERTFEFGDAGDDVPVGSARKPGKRIASAVNLIDTLTARLTAARHVHRVLRIESYLESPESLRLAHQWASVTAPLWWMPGLRQLAQRQIDLLPEGPTETDRAAERLSVVVEIEDLFGQPLINWRLATPSSYDFTACTAVAVVERLPAAPAVPGSNRPDGSLTGWQTPGVFLTEGAKLVDPVSGQPLVPGTEPPRAAVPVAARRECAIYVRWPS
jgi:short subunit dehydrogenase-like uncharacterized protein